MVIAIPLVIGVAAISTNHHTELSLKQTRAAMDVPTDVEGSLLDGTAKSFVIVGSATSYAWPHILQDMLDDHAGARVYHVLNASAGQPSVQAWIADPFSKEYDSTFGAMCRDYFGDESRLRTNAPAPTIALCQQSLAEIVNPKGPVRSMDDKEGIEIGADALQRLAARLHDRGVERVYIATHIFNEGAEPFTGNERLALAELLRRDDDVVFEGPDVWSLTLPEFPGCYASDRLHPNQRGMKILAEAWYRTIAGSQARQAVIDRMYEKMYDVEELVREHLRTRVPG
jgi:hypothetical protein